MVRVTLTWKPRAISAKVLERVEALITTATGPCTWRWGRGRGTCWTWAAWWWSGWARLARSAWEGVAVAVAIAGSAAAAAAGGVLRAGEGEEAEEGSGVLHRDSKRESVIARQDGTEAACLKSRGGWCESIYQRL